MGVMVVAMARVRNALAIMLVLSVIFSTVICEGEELETKLDDSKIVQVEAYKDTTVVLKSDGTVWGWGENISGILGESRDKYIDSPAKIEGFEDIAQISMGNGYLLAVKMDGSLMGVGKNDVGIINPDKLGSTIKKPSQIKGIFGIRCVSAGINYAMAISNDGAVYIWGDYRYKTSESFKTPPRQVKHAKDAVIIAASRYNAFVIDREHKAWFLRGYLHKPEEIENLKEIAEIYESDKLTYAVSTDGSLWYWTINGQLTRKLEGIDGVEKLTSCGLGDMIALDKSGYLWRWNVKDLKPYRVEGIENIKDIAAGDSHIAALKEDGSLWAWGENSSGQLGDGGKYIQRIPQEVPGLSEVVMLSASRDFAAALLKDGTVWAWGRNNYGQLGNGTRVDSLQPVKVEGIEGVAYISAGVSHMTAVKEDGTVWSWGSNSSGELGDGTYEDRLTPVQTLNLKRIAAVSAGNGFSLALTNNGAVWVWGNSSYEPEKHKKDIDISKPMKIEKLSAIESIAAGDECAAAVSRGGTVTAWGNNYNGQLGFLTKQGDQIRERPGIISGCSYTKSISIGGGHILSLSRDGVVKAWGRNDFCQLGKDAAIKHSSPKAVEGMEDIVSVSAGGNQSFAIDKWGRLWVWGDNSKGQLGPNLENIIKQPVRVSFIYNVKQIVCGGGYTLALTGEGKVMGWGFNKYGQLGTGSKSSSYVEKPNRIE